MNWQIVFLGDGDENAAARRAVEFGHHQPGDARRLAEGVHLQHGVLADGRVEHQQHGVRRPWVGLLHDAHDFLEFGHEFGAVLQTAGGVHQQNIGVLLARGADGVEGQTRRVRAVGAGDNGRFQPRAPHAQLLHRRRAKRVAGGEHHAFALEGPFGGELGDGRRLAGAVDADDQHDERPDRLVDVEGQRHRRENAFDLAGENRRTSSGSMSFS